MKTISLFTGAGGLDIGATAAGADIACCVDTDSDSIETLRINSNSVSTAHLEADVTQLSGSQLLEKSGCKPGEVAFMIGGPPCQSFSKNNYWTKSGHESKRRKLRMKASAEEEGREFIDTVKLPRQKNRVGVANDHRTSLVMEYARLISEVKPLGFLFENVQSITHPKNKVFLEQFIDFTSNLGYKTTQVSLSSESFGVAQKRKRVFVTGHLSRAPEVPEPTHSEDPSLFLEPIATAKSAIHKFRFKKYHEPEEVITGRWSEYFPDIPPGMNYKALTSWAGYENPVFEAETRFWNFLLKLHPDKPSWTIAAAPGPWVGPIHWENRRLPVPELAALQSFPDGYKFAGKRRSQVQQIGNAVPALMAQAVMAKLIEI